MRISNSIIFIKLNDLFRTGDTDHNKILRYILYIKTLDISINDHIWKLCLIYKTIVFASCFCSKYFSNAVQFVFFPYIYNGINRHNKLEKYTVTKHFIQQVPENKYFLPTYLWFTPQSSINGGLMGKISR